MAYFFFWAPEFGCLCQYTGMKILLNVSLKDMDIAVCRKSEVGFGNRVGIMKIGRNIVSQKRLLRK